MQTVKSNYHRLLKLKGGFFLQFFESKFNGGFFFSILCWITFILDP